MQIVITLQDENTARKAIEIINIALKSEGLKIAPECIDISAAIMEGILKTQQLNKLTMAQDPLKKIGDAVKFFRTTKIQDSAAIIAYNDGITYYIYTNCPTSALPTDDEARNYALDQTKKCLKALPSEIKSYA